MWNPLVVEILYKNSMKALPLCYPNPAVGAVFVSSKGKILGEGCTQPYGQEHAEVIAIQEVQKNYSQEVLQEGILYTNLTPCCHEGKTSSCVDFLLSKGIKNIYIVQDDPNPLVYKKSLQKLKDAGVYVDMNCPQEYKEKFTKINEVFFSQFTRDLPWVTLKYATTIDGKIATVSGDSKWISCDVSRNEKVQFLRATHGAISVGDNTVLKDDPRLTVRKYPIKISPVRVVFNMGQPLPLGSQVFSLESKTIIVLPFTAENSYKQQIQDLGHQILEVDSPPNLRTILRFLKTQQIDSLLLEGGGKLISWFWRERVIDKVFCFIAPKILGSRGMSLFDSDDTYFIENISQSISLQDLSFGKCGETFLISGYIPREV